MTDFDKTISDKALKRPDLFTEEFLAWLQRRTVFEIARFAKSTTNGDTVVITEDDPDTADLIIRSGIANQGSKITGLLKIDEVIASGAIAGSATVTEFDFNTATHKGYVTVLIGGDGDSDVTMQYEHGTGGAVDICTAAQQAVGVFSLTTRFRIYAINGAGTSKTTPTITVEGIDYGDPRDVPETWLTVTVDGTPFARVPLYDFEPPL